MPGFIRQALDATALDDSRYWQKLPDIFELQRGASGLIGTGAMTRLPLMLGPTEMTWAWDFANQLDLAQDGGVHVAEYGTILGRCSINVDPGVAPRANELGGALYSGQARWLQFYQLLDEYSQLKQNPNWNTGTQLVLHNLKDAQSWIVIPQRLQLRRDAREATKYIHSVELTIIGKYTLPQPPASTSLLETLKGPARTLRAALQKVTADIQDITNYVNAATSVIGAYSDLTDGVTAIASATQALLDGTARFIMAPQSAVTRTLDMLEQLLRVDPALQMEGALIATGTLPTGIPPLLTSWMFRTWLASCEDNLLQIAACKSRFAEPLDSKVGRRQQYLLGAAGYSSSALTAATGTLAGTGARASDSLRAQANAKALRSGLYAGWVEREITRLDTPEGIAIQVNTPWADIAAANGLRAPYFSETLLPCTVAPGGKIIVPATSGSPRDLQANTSGSRVRGGSQQDELFGRDLQLDAEEGIAIDTRYGAEDFLLIAGVDNVVQAIGMLVDTVRGEDVLYPTRGRSQTVGTAQGLDSELLVRIDVQETVRQDLRVKSVQGVLTERTGDSIAADVRATLADDTTLRTQGRLLT